MRTTPKGLAGAALALAVGCAQPTGVVVQPATPAATAPPSTGSQASSDGFYLTPQMSRTASAVTTTFTSSVGCAELVDILGAGEWRETRRATFPPEAAFFTAFLGTPIEVTTLFERGGRTAWVTASGGEHCTARVTELVPQPLVAQGGVDFDGTALVYPFHCISMSSQPDKVHVRALFEAGGVVAMLGFSTGAARGEHPYEAADQDPVVGEYDRWFFDAFAEGVRAQLAGETPSEDPAVADQELVEGPDFAGSVEVTATEPFAGTVDLQGLVRADGTPQSLRAAFRCDVTAMDNGPPEAPNDDPVPGVDPCELVTLADIEAVLPTPVTREEPGEPLRAQETCDYAADGDQASVLVQVFSAEEGGLTLDETYDLFAGGDNGTPVAGLGERASQVGSGFYQSIVVQTQELVLLVVVTAVESDLVGPALEQLAQTAAGRL